MDRTAATTWLTSEFAELATDAGLSGDQLTTAYSNVVDMALRQLGVAETDLATYSTTQDQVQSFLALLNYYALKRYARLFSMRVAVALPGPTSAQRNQAFQQVNALLNAAEADLVKLGVDLGSSTWQMGRVNLDFLEPGSQGEFGIPPVGLWWW
jgi:hypothetical protein